MDGVHTYKSEFSPDSTIMIITSDCPYYDTFEPKFQELGYGFLMPDQNTIIIDGEKLIEEGGSSDLFKFIEAHEVGHILLKHDGPRSAEQELEADLAAYIILDKYGYKDSIKMLLKNFKFRHNMKFKPELLDKVKNLIPEL